jgi:methylmalonyl-CoA/ethylmalonyl-CoA epimerase
MFVRLDHVGVVAHSWDEATQVLVDTLGFPVDSSRTVLPDGNLYVPQNTRIYFVKIGEGETRIEILIPQDTTSGIAKWLAKRGPSLHHLGYAVTDVPADAAELRAKGLEQIQLGNPSETPRGIFFYPKGTMGILTELVPDRRAPVVQPASTSSG